MTHEQEALELLVKHNGPHFTVARIGAIAAIKEALRQRDQAREEHRFALAAESAAIATLTAQRDKAVEALRVFAEEAESYADERDEWPLFEVHDIQVKHLRQAAAVVREIEGK